MTLRVIDSRRQAPGFWGISADGTIRAMRPRSLKPEAAMRVTRIASYLITHTLMSSINRAMSNGLAWMR